MSLDWHLLDYEMHSKLHHYVRKLNHFYLGTAHFGSAIMYGMASVGSIPMTAARA